MSRRVLQAMRRALEVEEAALVDEQRAAAALPDSPEKAQQVAALKAEVLFCMGQQVAVLTQLEAFKD